MATGDRLGGIKDTPTHEGENLLQEAHSRLANRQLVEAIHLFGEAELLGSQPNICAAGRWEARMLLGDFDGAWQESDFLRRQNLADPHRLWNGEPLQGSRLMLRCLHGLGDAIQMLRYAPVLQSIADRLVVQVHPRLKELARCVEGVEEVVTWDELEERPFLDWDMEVEVMELPYIFRSTIETIPRRVPYIHVKEEEQFDIRERMMQLEHGSLLPRVGVCWSCGDWNPSRALPFPYLEQLLVRDDLAFYNLQDGAAAECWMKAGLAQNCRDAGVFGQGLARLAATIANLDLVISVDTMVAHLAGAMGKPVWLLLQHAADWRWLHGVEFSVWYPTMRIMRQHQQGNWQSVMEGLSLHFAEVIHGR